MVFKKLNKVTWVSGPFYRIYKVSKNKWVGVVLDKKDKIERPIFLASRFFEAVEFFEVYLRGTKND